MVIVNEWHWPQVYKLIVGYVKETGRIEFDISAGGRVVFSTGEKEIAT
jgi:hypothetical protein